MTVNTTNNRRRGAIALAAALGLALASAGAGWAALAGANETHTNPPTALIANPVKPAHEATKAAADNVRGQLLAAWTEGNGQPTNGRR
jgi:hypothetical protein